MPSANDDKLTSLAEHLAAALPGIVQEYEIRYGELVAQAPRDAVLAVLTFLRDDPLCRFTVLCDICGVDYPDRPMRFEVVYNLLSMTRNQRIRVKIETDEEQAVPSCVGVFSAAGWWEREAWDLMGIQIDGHPNLKRILLDDDWEGHPLRKDYPLGGEPVRFSGEE